MTIAGIDKGLAVYIGIGSVMLLELTKNPLFLLPGIVAYFGLKKVYKKDNKILKVYRQYQKTKHKYRG